MVHVPNATQWNSRWFLVLRRLPAGIRSVLSPFYSQPSVRDTDLGLETEVRELMVYGLATGLYM